jgi:hypothetical protein
LELLLSLWCFLDLREAFLRVFSNLSNVLLNWANYCFAGLAFFTCLLGSTDFGYHHSVFLIPVTVLGSVRGMHAPMILAKFAGLLKTAFLRNLLCSSSTGPLGSCLTLLRSFLAGLHMGFLRGTHTLNSLERCLKRTHVHGSHPFFLAGCTDPATHVNTSRECNLPDQPG